MSLSPIAAVSTQLLDLLKGITGSSSSSAAAAQTSSLSSSSLSGTVDLSDVAQTLSKLQQLSQTDPTKFKQLTARISSELQTAAQKATGSEASTLTTLSNDFNTASQTGSVASLEPQHTQTATHHGRYGGHHPSAYTADTINTTGSTNNVLQRIFQQVASA